MTDSTHGRIVRSEWAHVPGVSDCSPTSRRADVLAADSRRQGSDEPQGVRRPSFGPARGGLRPGPGGRVAVRRAPTAAPAVAPTVGRLRRTSWALSWPEVAALVQRALTAALGLSTMGVLGVWFGPHDPSAPVPAVASAASALMFVGLLLGSPLVVWVSAHALRRTAADPAHFHPLHRAVRRRTWAMPGPSPSCPRRSRPCSRPPGPSRHPQCCLRPSSCRATRAVDGFDAPWNSNQRSSFGSVMPG